MEDWGYFGKKKLKTHKTFSGMQYFIASFNIARRSGRFIE